MESRCHLGKKIVYDTINKSVVCVLQSHLIADRLLQMEVVF